MARKARDTMTPGEIADAARIARAEMRLLGRQREHWRRMVKHYRGELDRDDARRQIRGRFPRLVWSR
jgi:hypothetical protein